MNGARSILEHLGRVLPNPDRGVVGFVDELLAASREHDLRLGWQDGLCRGVVLGGDPTDRLELTLRKSVVRAALARIAFLCNERTPDSVSPYGGHGEVAIDADPSKVIRAAFTNTPETLGLELASVSSEVASLVGLSPLKSPD